MKEEKNYNRLLSRGTQHQFTAPHTSAHNRRVERIHGTLMGKARAIEIRLDKTLSLAHSTSALLLQPGLDVLHNHDDIMIMYLIFLSPYL